MDYPWIYKYTFHCPGNTSNVCDEWGEGVGNRFYMILFIFWLVKFLLKKEITLPCHYLKWQGISQKRNFGSVDSWKYRIFLADIFQCSQAFPESKKLFVTMVSWQMISGYPNSKMTLVKRNLCLLPEYICRAGQNVIFYV